MAEKFGTDRYGMQMRRRRGPSRERDGGPSTGRAGTAGDGGGAAIPAPAGTQRDQDVGAGTGLRPEQLGQLHDCIYEGNWSQGFKQGIGKQLESDGV